MRTWNSLVTIPVSCLLLAMVACASLTQVPPATSKPISSQSSSAITILPTATPTASPQPINLHSVDWETFIYSDSNLNHPNPPFNLNYLPFVEEKSPTNGEQGSRVMGFAMIHKILYGDFSSQGQEAAVIPIFNPNQAQSQGFLIYISGNDTPILVATVNDIFMTATIDSGQLVTTQEIWGWTSPLTDYPDDRRVIGYIDKHYRLQGNHLVVEQSNRGEPTYRRTTVAHFYEAVKYKRFQEAYALLSPNFKRNNPYDRWVAGYQDMISFSTKISEQPDGSIGVEISSTDKTPTGDKVQYFSGSWSLVWDSTSFEWLLDKSNIVNVPYTGTRSLDWAQIIETDPSLVHLDPFPNHYMWTGPFVAQDKDPTKGSGGWAMVDDVFHANIMGSAQEQTFVWVNDYSVFPECNPYHTGLLIYKTDNTKPELAAAIWGYDLSAVVHGNQLIIREMVPTDFAFKGKCANLGFRETLYSWQSNHLATDSFIEVSYGPETIDMFQSFYNLIQSKKYADAYALLSPAFQAANPFDRWALDYRNVISIDSGIINENGFIGADVTSIEQTDTGQVTKHYIDRWVLVRDSKSKPGQWYLDHPENIPNP